MPSKKRGTMSRRLEMFRGFVREIATCWTTTAGSCPMCVDCVLCLCHWCVVWCKQKKGKKDPLGSTANIPKKDIPLNPTCPMPNPTHRQSQSLKQHNLDQLQMNFFPNPLSQSKKPTPRHVVIFPPVHGEPSIPQNISLRSLPMCHLSLSQYLAPSPPPAHHIKHPFRRQELAL